MMTSSSDGSAFRRTTSSLESRGRGSTANDQPLSVSTTPTLATGFRYDIRQGGDTNLKEYAAFSVRARAVRRLGSAVLYLAWLASGRLDGYWELRPAVSSSRRPAGGSPT